MVRTYSADSLEQIVMNTKDGLPPDLEFRVYCMERMARIFESATFISPPEGVAVVSGLDDAGNSIYTVSHFQRMQIVYEISKVAPNQTADKRLIGFSR